MHVWVLGRDVAHVQGDRIMTAILFPLQPHLPLSHGILGILAILQFIPFRWVWLLPSD